MPQESKSFGNEVFQTSFDDRKIKLTFKKIYFVNDFSSCPSELPYLRQPTGDVHVMVHSSEFP